MRNLQGKSKIKRFLESWPVVITLSLLMVFFTWQLFGFWSKLEDTKLNRQNSEDRLNELKASQENLVKSIASLETEEGIDENIRNKFGLAKEGEGVIVIVEDPNKVNKAPEKKENWFKAFFTNLFGL